MDAQPVASKAATKTGGTNVERKRMVEHSSKLTQKNRLHFHEHPQVGVYSTI